MDNERRVLLVFCFILNFGIKLIFLFVWMFNLKIINILCINNIIIIFNNFNIYKYFFYFYYEYIFFFYKLFNDLIGIFVDYELKN